MVRLLSARDGEDASEMHPRGQKNTARTQCYDYDGALMICPESGVQGTAAQLDAREGTPTTIVATLPQLEHTTTTDTSTAKGENALGESVPTATPSSAITKTTVWTTSSPSATDQDPSLVSAGTVEAPGSGNHGLSSGAVAGIAIGTLIAGAIFGFIAAFFIFKRRNKQTHGNIGGAGYRNYGDSAPELNMMQKSVGSLGDMHSPYVQVPQAPMLARRSVPPPTMPIAAVTENATHADVAGFLPPAAQDGEVCEKVSGLFEKMHEHIERNYRDIHASITPSMESGIASFGAKGVDMTELLRECSSPTTALKHALVSYILGITSPKTQGEGAGTLFPEELSRPTVEGRNNSSDPDVVAAASLLRRVSAYLYTATSGTRESRQSWVAQSSAREAAEHFSLTFFPWANPTCSDQQKDEELTFMIMEVLETSIWLFGQPDKYEFQWGGAGRGGVVVSPGLVRRTMASGEEREIMVVEGAVVGM